MPTVGTMSRRPLLTELGRYLAVGGLATLVALVIFNSLVHVPHAPLDDHPIVGYIAANSVGMVISYELSRAWTWRHRPPSQADGGRTRYFLINAATMSLPIACLWISRHTLGDSPVTDNLSANVVGLVLGQMARFYLFRTFVFRHPVNPLKVYDDPDEASLSV